MEKNSRHESLMIDFSSKFNQKNIENFFVKIPLILNEVEYFEFRPENIEQLSSEKFILETPQRKLRSVFILFNERGFQLSFYRSDKDELSIFMKRFGNYFDLDVDALDGRTILDIARYITIMLDVCEDLVIKNIAYDIDRDNDVFFIHSSTGQALSVALGSPLGSPSNKTYHDYIKAIMKNMQNSTAITPRDMQGNAISAEIFYKGLMREGAAGQELKDYEWRCSWHGYEVMVRLTPYDILTIQPTGTMKMKDADGVPAVDVGFYSRFMLEICKGIGILELKTYF